MPIINLTVADDDDADLLSRSFYCPTAAVVQLLPACPPLLCKVLTCPFCSMDWPPPCQLTHLCCSVAAACWTPLLCQIRTCSFCSKIERRRVCCRIRCCSVIVMIIIIIIIRPRPAPAHKVQTRFAAPVSTAHPLLLCSFCLPAPLCSALPTLRAYAATVPASVRASDRVNVKPHTHNPPTCAATITIVIINCFASAAATQQQHTAWSDL